MGLHGTTILLTYFSTHSEPIRSVAKMLHLIHHENQLQSLIVPLSDDFHMNIGIHFCALEHREINCCGFSETMHNGTCPGITMIYLNRNCLRGAEIIAEDLR